MGYNFEVAAIDISSDDTTEKDVFRSIWLIKTSMKPISATSKSNLNLLSVLKSFLHSKVSGPNFCDLPNLTMVLVENIPEPTTSHELFGSKPRPRGSYLNS